MNNDLRLDLSGIPNELRLILQIIQMKDDDTMLLDKKKLFADIDWNLFLKLAMHHCVFPLIYLYLKKINEELVPKHLMEHMRKVYQTNTFRMLYLSREMEKISKLFLENDVRMLVLKGPVLAFDLYGDVSLRTSVDIDILVSPDDLDKANKILVDSGYVKHDFFSTVLSDWKWRIHHLDFVHPQTKISLEVHWRLHPGPGKEPSFDELWKGKRKSSLTDYPVYYLGREELFLFLVTHGARHGWARLSWLVDSDKILKQSIDLNKLNKLLKKYQCLQIAGQALILCRELLNTPIKKETETLKVGKWSRRLAQEALFYIKQMVNLHSDPVPEDVRRFHSRYLFALMSYQQKFVFIMNFFYPYPMDADILPLPKYLHFLYFPLRPIFWAWRKTQRCKQL